MPATSRAVPRPISPEDGERSGGALPDEGSGQADRRGPGDSPGRVPDGKGSPVHLRCAGEPRGPGSQPEDPASEEHGLRPMACEEGLAELQDASAVSGEGTGALQQPRSESTRE